MNRNESGMERPAAGAQRPRGILMVVPWELHHAGGVNVVVKALMREFAARADCSVQALLMDWAAVRPREREHEGRQEILMRLRAPALGHISALAGFMVSLPRALLALSRLLRRRNVRYVNIHYPQLTALNFVLLRYLWRNAPRVVLSFHGADLTNITNSSPAVRRLWRWMARHVHGLTACSQRLAIAVEHELARPRGSVRAIHNGTDVDELSAALSTSEIPAAMADGRRWLLNIATFEAKKGQDVLIDAFARIAREFPDVRLMLVGRAGSVLPALREQAATLGVAEQVVFHDAVPHAEVPGYLRGAEIFVLPSREEPFGIVILEAGGAGLPVVASRVGGVPEIIDSPAVGALVEPNDPEALVHALRKLLRRPGTSTALGAALRMRVINDFSWRHCADGYLQEMQSVSSGHCNGQDLQPATALESR